MVWPESNQTNDGTDTALCPVPGTILLLGADTTSFTANREDMKT